MNNKKYSFNTLLDLLHEHDYIGQHDEGCIECQKVMDYGHSLYKQGGGFTTKGMTVEERTSKIKTLVQQGCDVSTIAQILDYSEGHILRLLRKLGLVTNSKSKPEIKIYQLKDNEVVDTFDTIASAARKNQIKESSISNCIVGKQKTAAGFSWKRIGK